MSILLLVFSMIPGLRSSAQIDSVDRILRDTEYIPLDEPKVAVEENTDSEAETEFIDKNEYPDTSGIQYRKLQDDRIRKMKQDDAFWYADATIEKENPEDNLKSKRNVPLTERAWFKTLFWIIVVGSFVAFI